MPARRPTQYSCFPVDDAYVIGSEWGAESEEFLRNVDVRVRVGVGKQALAETAAVRASGRPIIEFDLAALPKTPRR